MWLLPILVAAAVLAGCGGDDGADVTPPDEPIGGPYPVADLEITVTHPDRDDLQYRVVCLGDTATVTGDEGAVDEADACLALADPDVVQRLVDGPPDDRVCTEQYGGPDVATITGTIDDAPVDTMVDRVNGCGISEWDVLLAALLPPAVGPDAG